MSINQEYNGIILVDKSVGQSSFASVAQFRRLVGVKRVGHCGTLDPFADGLLPIIIGRATALSAYMDAYDKEYLVELVWGAATNTQDCEGEIVESIPIEVIRELYHSGELSRRIEAVLPELTGAIWQKPPMYSAVKIAGKALYSYAREGIELERKARLIQVGLLERSEPYFAQDGSLRQTFLLHCSKGSYVRTWVDELGRKTAVLAYATQLRRMRCGPFRVEAASKVEPLFDLFNGFERSALLMREALVQGELLLPLETAFPDWPRIQLDEMYLKAALCGKVLPLVSEQLVAGTDASRYQKLKDFIAEPTGLETAEQRVLCMSRLGLTAIAALNIDCEGNLNLTMERVLVNHESI